jgi:hypothetical protein
MTEGLLFATAAAASPVTVVGAAVLRRRLGCVQDSTTSILLPKWLASCLR